MRKHLTPEADDWWGSVAMATGTTHAAALFAHASMRVNTERRSFRIFQRQRVKKKKKKKQPTHGTLCPACPSSPRLKPETQTLQMTPQRRQHTRSSLKSVTDLDLEASYSKHASHTHRNDRHAIPAPPVTRQPDLPRTEGEAHI